MSNCCACDSFCDGPERTLEEVREQTIERLGRWQGRRIPLEGGLQAIIGAVDFLRAGYYFSRLKGRKGNDWKYVRKVRDYSFELKVNYLIE